MEVEGAEADDEVPGSGGDVAAEALGDLVGGAAELEPSTGHLGFAVPLRLRTSRGELHLMTTVTTFATAIDVTLSELKLEAFLPADQATADALQLAASARAPSSLKPGSFRGDWPC